MRADGTTHYWGTPTPRRGAAPKRYALAMRTTIDAAGRVVIPKELRSRLALVGGQELEIREREGCIELEPAGASMSLLDAGGGPAAVPAEELPPLTDEIVRETMERSRR
jgi:AbrB family looped-hinge helix DNA binding protein